MYNRITLAWLSASIGLDYLKIESLYSYFKTSKNIWENFKTEIDKLNILSPIQIESMIKLQYNFEEKLDEKLKKYNVKITTYFDDDYPQKLRDIKDPPYILYYIGELSCLDNISIGVVGARKATGYGKWTAEKFVKDLALLDVTIISGLALGIDTIAHKSALKYKTKTVGVIGSGVDIVYPKSNENLYKDIIVNSGLIITEFSFGIKPMAYNFPIRNRIISGLSDGILVVEAQERSGTLITAGYAAEQGKDVFAIPGNIDSLYSRGTNHLIKDGAKITVSIEDIVEEIKELNLRMKKLNRNHNQKTVKFTLDENKIMNCLKEGNKDIYEIEKESNLNISDILSLITILEMKNSVKKINGNKYMII